MTRDVQILTKRDHIESLASGAPLAALQELIWNALDADAHEVRIDLVTNGLGGVDAIRVSDDGSGIDILHIEDTFGGIGGSWKLDARRTRSNNRVLHGRRGKGRFKAFSLGSHVEWRTTMKMPEGLLSYTISGDADDLTRFTLSQSGSTGPASGTEVYISNVKASADSLCETGDTVQALAAAFALYLKSYPDVSIFFCGIPVSPVIVQKAETEYKIETSLGAGATLKLIEWRRRMTGTGRLVFCGEDRFSLHDLPVGVRPSAGHSFTAYLVSPRFAELSAEGMLELDELSDEVRSYVVAVRAVLRKHFREIASDEMGSKIHDWLEEGIYPYLAEDSSQERIAFDKAAVDVGARIDGFDAMRKSERGMILRLLKAALKSGATLPDLLG